MSSGTRALSAAVALAAVAVLTSFLTSGPRRESPRLPLATSTALRPQPQPAAPGAREILAETAALELTAAQRARLEVLDQQWRPREREFLDAVKGAEREMSGVAAGGRPVALRELQQRAAGFAELSADLREARAQHADDALAILTNTQRQRVREMTDTTTRPGGSNEARTN